MTYPTQEYLRDKFYYLFETNLYWKQANGSRTVEKTKYPAGNISKDGYRRISIDRKTYTAQRLIWIYHFGDIPEGLTIDHIDGDRSNNRIDNLRLATRQQQQLNRQSGLPTYIRCTGKAYSAIIKFKDGTVFKKTYAKQAHALACPQYLNNLDKKYAESGLDIIYG